MLHFDVLKEPWIPVRTSTGQTETLGLNAALAHAHTLREVACDSPLETYAVQRLMIAYLMDAYGLETVYERKALYKRGRFDPEVLERYAQLCRLEGVTFDLFDEERPFMQARFDPALDTGKEKPVANLFHALPTGNNHVHFDHGLAASQQFTPGECLCGILACQLFAVHMTGDYPSSVNDTPCYYVLLQGDTLFETLTLSMLAKGECKGMAWVQPPTAWRDTDPVIPKSEFADVSLLAGLTWQPRRLTLIPDDDGLVRRMYFQPGRSFHPNGRWRDPHVSFAINKEGNPYSLKPHLGRDPWRDIGVFALSKQDKDSIPATIILQSTHLLSEEAIRKLRLFGIATSNAKYEGWLSDQLNVPGSVLLDWEKADRLRLDVGFIESVAAQTRRTAKSIANAQERTKDGKAKQSHIIQSAEAEYFERMHRFLFAVYMEALGCADCSEPQWELPLMRSTERMAIGEARRIVLEYAGRMGNTARDLQAQTSALQAFERSLNKLLKERLGK